jgi:hypothetical protein
MLLRIDDVVLKTQDFFLLEKYYEIDDVFDKVNTTISETADILLEFQSIKYCIYLPLIMVHRKKKAKQS